MDVLCMVVMRRQLLHAMLLPALDSVSSRVAQARRARLAIITTCQVAMGDDWEPEVHGLSACRRAWFEHDLDVGERDRLPSQYATLASTRTQFERSTVAWCAGRAPYRAPTTRNMQIRLHSQCAQCLLSTRRSQRTSHGFKDVSFNVPAHQPRSSEIKCSYARCGSH